LLISSFSQHGLKTCWFWNRRNSYECRDTVLTIGRIISCAKKLIQSFGHQFTPPAQKSFVCFRVQQASRSNRASTAPSHSRAASNGVDVVPHAPPVASGPAGPSSYYTLQTAS